MVENVKAVERELSFYRFCYGGGFAEAEIEIPEAEALQWIVTAIVGISGKQSRPELGDRSGGIAEIVEAGSGPRGRAARSITGGARTRAADARVNRATAQRAYWNSGDFTGRRAEDQAATEGLAANGDELGHATAGAEDAGGVPATNELVHEPDMAFEGQLVIEDGVENMWAIEEGRSVIEMRVEAGRVVARIVLNGADRVERLGEGVVEIEQQAVPGIVAQIDDQGVVIGIVAAGASEEINDLGVIERRQTQLKSAIDVHVEK